MRDRPQPAVRALLLVLGAVVGAVAGLGSTAETGWPVLPAAVVGAVLFVAAMWWASR